MNKKELAAAISARASVSRETCVKVLDALADVVLEVVKTEGSITIPDVVKVVRVERPSRPSREMFSPILKRTVTVAAKPASRKVMCKPTRALKEGVVDDPTWQKGSLPIDPILKTLGIDGEDSE